MPTCAELAAAQLRAYNARDTDAFCRCYSDDVLVLDSDGGVTLQGMAAFRARYAGLFGQWQEVGAHVGTRLVCEPHVIDDEDWWRSRDGQDGGREEARGRVLVRYTARDGRITTVQFFREES